MPAQRVLACTARTLIFSSRCCCQPLLLCTRVPEQLEQVVGGSVQVPFGIGLLQASQQEPSQAPGFLDLAVYRLHDRHELGVDPGSFLAFELAGHARLEVGIFRHRSPSRRRRLVVRQAAGVDIGINPLIRAGLGVVLARVARIHRHHVRR